MHISGTMQAVQTLERTVIVCYWAGDVTAGCLFLNPLLSERVRVQC